MVKQFKAKTFKSGNSVALRLPKGLGVEEGREMMVREEQGRYIVEPVDAPRKRIDLSFLEGRSFGLRLLSPEDREIDPTPGLDELLAKASWAKPKP
ncbi:MAG: AbrB/MazE/SpoVT family DNA-binding domain-containing protein [Sphingomicrobium sp.]